MAEAVIILGMQRSGAGTVAGLAQAVGLHLGKDLMKPAKGSKRSLFEDSTVVEVNQRLLRDLDAPRVTGCPLPKGWMDLPAGKLARHSAAERIEELAIAGHYGLRDPRLTWTAPLWQAEMTRRGDRIRHVVVVRDPLDMAAGLEDSTPEKRLLFLTRWMSQMVQILRVSQGHPRLFVGFRSVLTEPQGVALQLRRFCTLGETFRPGDAEAVRTLVPENPERDMTVPDPQGFVEETARNLARLMMAGNDAALEAELASGPSALLAALQDDTAQALRLASRGPLMSAA